MPGPQTFCNLLHEVVVLLVRRGTASSSAPAAYYCGVLLLLLLQDPKDPFQGMYDEEVVLLLTDQSNISGEVELEKLQKVRLQPIDAAGATITGQHTAT